MTKNHDHQDMCNDHLWKVEGEGGSASYSHSWRAPGAGCWGSHFQAWASKWTKMNFTPSRSSTSKSYHRPELNSSSWILTLAFSLIYFHSVKVGENQKTKILIQVSKLNPQNKKVPQPLFSSRTISQFTTRTWVCRDFNVSATGFFRQPSTLSPTEWLLGQFQSGPWYFGQEDSWSRIFISFSSQLQFTTDLTGSHFFQNFSFRLKSVVPFRYITLMIFFLYNVWVVPLRATFNIYQERMVFEII